jgi:hypothetical protein
MTSSPPDVVAPSAAGDAEPRRRWWVAGLLAILVLVPGLAALDQYNVTWDEALGDLFFGDRYLSFFLSFDRRYLDFAADPYPQDRVPDLSSSPFRDRPWEYYPIANVLAASTSRLLSGVLPLLDPFDGFHAVNVLLAAAFVVFLYLFAERRLGAPAALVACGLLLLGPRVVCHMLANVKDFPEMVFFSVTLLVFFVAYETRSVAQILLAGFFWGLALGTKANALFIPPIVGLFVIVDLVVARRAGPHTRRWPWGGRGRRLCAALAGAATIGGALMVATWPYLWGDPVGRFVRHLAYVSGQVFQVRAESLADPLLALVLTTPPVFVVLALVGLGLGVRRSLDGDPLSLLLVLWVVVVLGRLYLPGAVNFDGVRHFLEVFPALALLAGAAAGELARLLGRRLSSGVVLALLVVGVLAAPAVAVWRTHPHEIAYWNAFTGGLSGARARGLAQAGDYWGMSYRQGLRFIREHAPPGTVLAVPVLEHAVTLVAPLRLRADVGLVALTRPVRPEIDPRRLARLRALALERRVWVMFVRRDDWENELMRECRERFEPLRSWRVDGEPILEIYDYSAALQRSRSDLPEHIDSTLAFRALVAPAIPQ